MYALQRYVFCSAIVFQFFELSKFYRQKIQLYSKYLPLYRIANRCTYSNNIQLCCMDIDIGNLILKKLNAIGMSKSEFARRINKSPQNVQDIFTRTSIDTALLQSISKVLEFNFFTLYTNEQTTLTKKDFHQLNEKLNAMADAMQLLVEQNSKRILQKKGKKKGLININKALK